MWFSATPESLARHHTFRAACAVTENKMAARGLFNESTIALDPFCGTGNNTIHLSSVFDEVYACDINDDTLDQANNNVLNSGEKACFYKRNFFDYQPNFRADVIFMSPPWGGLDYNSSSYSLEDLARSLGEHPRDMLLLARSFAPNVILYLPKSTDIDEILQLVAPLFNSIDIEFNIKTNRLMTLTIYLGNDLCSFREERKLNVTNKYTHRQKTSTRIVAPEFRHFDLRDFIPLLPRPTIMIGKNKKKRRK